MPFSGDVAMHDSDIDSEDFEESDELLYDNNCLDGVDEDNEVDIDQENSMSHSLFIHSLFSY